ncbi:MAG TPA: hypothetical protein IAA48_08945 [Candidatus Eubacterium faecipullorum]|uniref:Uncharacterized protein n=1 Tax=Candidatus Eubacterium faecipullorum TaxID=2838571 RepID=A0A9D1RFU3_9FIRM|nr:hypothetical protein [Candidatus Eubacterium faecipullorum]
MKNKIIIICIVVALAAGGVGAGFALYNNNTPVETVTTEPFSTRRIVTTTKGETTTSGSTANSTTSSTVDNDTVLTTENTTDGNVTETFANDTYVLDNRDTSSNSNGANNYGNSYNIVPDQEQEAGSKYYYLVSEKGKQRIPLDKREDSDGEYYKTGVFVKDPDASDVPSSYYELNCDDNGNVFHHDENENRVYHDEYKVIYE